MKMTFSLYNSSALYTRNTGLLAGVAFSLASLGMAQQALATPQDAVIVGGQISISQPDANHMTITQTTDRGIINWKSFDILNGQSVNIIQPGKNSIQLDRVTGGSPTKILGSLSSNGQVWLVNPNGVFFGAHAKVDVAGLVATTANISNENAMAGRLKFDQAGRADASVINEGTITAEEGGLVALVAPGVRNDGVITATLGTVALGAGETFTVDMYGDNLYSFAVAQKATKAALDQNGNVLSAAITNTGKISAQGGTIYMTANVAKEVVNQAINTTGIVDATSMVAKNGEIILDGGEGAVTVAGTLDASGKQAGQTGGKIQVVTDGNNITLASATIDASGANGGGSVKVGGDKQGSGSLKHAGSVKMDAGSKIDVSAINSGNGGEAVVWSDGSTQFAGTIQAKGGANGGNGGFAETSGHDLDVSGSVDASAANGANGSWLLDPINITINNLAAIGIDIALSTGTDVNVNTTNIGGQAGNITVASNIDKIAGGNATLTLSAANDIIVNSGVSIGSTHNKLNVVLEADRDSSGAGAIALNSGSSIRTNGGDVTFGGGAGSAHGDAAHTSGITLTDATVNANGGNILMNGTGFAGVANGNDGILLQGGSVVRTNGNGSITLNGTGGGTGSSAVNHGVEITGTGTLVRVANGDLNINGTGGLTTGDTNVGVLVQTGGAVRTDGTGNVNLTGTGGGIGASSNDVGVAVAALSIGDGTGVSSTAANGGNITITGYTGDNGGTGTNPGYYNGGVYINAPISTVDGNIAINGNTGLAQAVSTTSGNNSYGITTYNAADISSTGNGTITLTGVGAGTGSDSYGVLLQNGASIHSVNSDITINGTGANGANGIVGNNVNLGGASENGNITLNANALSLNAATIQTLKNIVLGVTGNVSFSNSTLSANNIIIDPLDVSLTNTDMNTVGDIVIDPAHDVALVNSSLTSGGNVIINNSGTFSSDTAGVLLGSVVNLNQNLPGSIQNAIDAINAASGTSKVTVGNGIFNQLVQISGRNNFTLTGSGSTVIQPTSLAGAPSIQNGTPFGGQTYAPIILAENGGNITVSNLTIDGSQVAGGTPSSALIYNNAGGTVSDVTLTQGGTFGLLAIADSNYGHAARTVDVDNTISSGNSWAAMAAIGDNLTFNVTGSTLNGSAGVEAMDYSNGSQGNFNNNTVTAGNSGDARGIALHGAHNVNIIGGTITGNGVNTAISDDGLAYGVAAASNVTVDGVGITNVGTGVSVNGGHNWNINNNTMFNIGGGLNGVVSNNATDLSVTNNHITNTVLGVSATGGSDVTILGNSIIGYGYGTGVSLTNVGGTNTIGDGTAAGLNDIAALNTGVNLDHTTAKVLANSVRGQVTGINLVNHSDNTLVDGNSISYITGTGIKVDGSDHVTLSNNTLGSQLTGDGIVVTNSDLTVTGNSITAQVAGNGTGISLTNVTGNANVVGDSGAGHANTVTGFATGISLNNSSADVGFNTLTNNTTGITVFNGSNGNLIANNAITGGDMGIWLSDNKNNTVDGNTVSNATVGIGSDLNRNLTVSNNTVKHVGTGITVANGTGTTDITGNKVKHATGNGILASNDKNLTVSGNTIRHAGSDGIAVIGSNGALVDNNKITDSDTAIAIASSNNVTVSDNVMKRIALDGINAFDTDHIKVTDNKILANGAGDVGAGRYGILVQNSHAAKVNKNLIQAKNGATGTGSEGIFILNSDHATMNRNTISATGGSTGTGGDGFVLAESNNSKVKHNVIESSFGSVGTHLDGIYVRNSNNAAVKDNSITANHNSTGAGSYGVYAESSNNLEINNNDITATGSSLAATRGIAVVNSNGADVSSNVIRRVTAEAITLNNSNNATVDNNRIRFADVGIALNGGNGNSLDGNTIRDTDVNGIQVVGSNGSSITDNTVRNSATGIWLTTASNSFVDGNTVLDTSIGIAADLNHNLTFSNNTVDVAGTGLSVTNGTGTTDIEHNIVTGVTGNGILANNVKNLTISHNTVSDPGSTAIAVNASNGAVIDHNSIDNFDTGVNVTNSNNVQVSDNDFTAITHDAIDASNANGISITGNRITASGFGNVAAGRYGIFVDLSNNATVDGNTISATLGAKGTGSTGIRVQNGNHAEITNNDIIAAAGSTGTGDDGIELLSSNNSLIDNNSIAAILGSLAVGADGIVVADSKNVTVSNNDIAASLFSQGTSRDGIYVRDSQSAIITGNTITASAFSIGAGTYGLYLQRDGASVHGDGITVTGNHVTADGSSRSANVDGINVADSSAGTNSGNAATVSSNTISRVGGNGIEINGTDGVIVDANNVSRSVNAIRVNDGANVSITGNHITNATGTGITANGDDGFTIAGNTLNHMPTGISVSNSTGTNANAINGNNQILGITGNGIVATNVGNLTISGNTISDPGNIAISINNDDGIVISNNVIDDFNYGIVVANSDNVTINGNALTHIATDGIDVSKGDTVKLYDNTLTGNAGSKRGIYLSQVTGAEVGDAGFNAVHDFDSGIVLSHSGGSVHGNKLFNNKVGINITNHSDNVNVGYNTIDGSKSTGINVDTSATETLVGNTLTNTLGKGIMLQTSNDTTIIGNTVTAGAASTSAGIYAANSDNVVIGKSGVGNDNTVTGFDTGIVLASGSDSGSVAYNTVNAGRVGIYIANSGAANVASNKVNDMTADGIIFHTATGNATANRLTNDHIGINVNTGSNGVLLSDNIIDLSMVGITLTDSDGVTAIRNQLTQVSGDGIDLFNSDVANLIGNSVSGTATANNGIYVKNSNGVVIGTSGVGNGNTISGFQVGIDLDSSNGATVAYNSLDTGKRGVYVLNSGAAEISTNTISGFSLDGIYFNGSSGNVHNNLLTNDATGIELISSNGVPVGFNQIDGSTTGIKVAASDAVTVIGNTLTNVLGDGIDVANSDGLSIRGNSLTAGVGAVNGVSLLNSNGTEIGNNGVGNGNIINGFDTGITVTGSSDVTIGSNQLTGNTNGVSLFSSDNAVFSFNTITGNGTGTGVLVSDSDNVTFNGDAINNNDNGIRLDNAQNASITGVTLDNDNVGLYALNGSGNILVSSTSFTNGGTGVLLDGAGTSMQFGDSNNSMTNEGFYFVLQNGAMNGDVLDASQQTFDGVVASNFTLSQFNAAEAKTIDFNDGFAVGTVFYRTFPFSFSFFNEALEDYQPFNHSLFSYAGHTVAGKPQEISYNFQVAQVDLSLLNPAGAAPTAPASVTVAANTSPEDLGNLAPAAGGNAQQLAELNPAAGGSPNCGNGFLGGGYSLSYSATSCSTANQ